jgi:hypothetical protein
MELSMAKILRSPSGASVCSQGRSVAGERWAGQNPAKAGSLKRRIRYLPLLGRERWVCQGHLKLDFVG